jgi:glycosyltransferase involved in cell wall biosynthesis
MNGLFLFGDKVFVKNLVAKRTSAVVALDKLMKDYIVERYSVRKESIPFIPLAVDVARFENCNGQPVRMMYGLHKSQPVILSLGTISNYRNPTGLIRGLPDVLKEFPNSKLLLVGAVHTDQPIRLAKELGLQDSVLFAGKVDYGMIPSYLGACDVEGHDLESGLGIGLASLEAMAAGKAVLSSAREDNFMNLELENWKNIVLVRPGNVKDISDALTQLLSERELREEIGKNARAFVKKHFTLDRVISTYAELYRRILQQ